MKTTEASGYFCDATSTHYYPASQQFSKSVYIFVCVVNVMGSISSTMGNIMILLALRKCQTLHSPSRALLCNLALTDLVTGLVVLPLFTAYYLTIILQRPTYYCIIAVTYGRLSSFIVAVSLGTIATISVDRNLAFHLRLRYRNLVTLRRIVCVLILEWVFAAFWTGSWFLSARVNVVCGTFLMLSCCLITAFCYINIHLGLRHHFAQIHHLEGSSESENFNMLQYKKTVNSMMLIYVVLLLCFMPSFFVQLGIVIIGLKDSTRFGLHFAAVVIYFNSSLNPVIYCWRIKELKQNVFANLRVLFHCLLPH